MRFGRHIAMPQVECMDPALATAQHAHQEPQLDQLRLREMPLQFGPERIISLSRIPRDGVGITESHFLAFAEQR